MKRRWGRSLTMVVSLIIVGGMAYCSSMYATAEKRVSGVCARLTPGMDVEAVANVARENGMNLPPRGSSSYIGEKATFGRYGCRLEFEGETLRSATYGFYD